MRDMIIHAGFEPLRSGFEKSQFVKVRSKDDILRLPRTVVAVTAMNTGVIGDGELELLSRLTSLRALDISGCEAVTDAGIAKLIRLSSLNELKMGLCRKVTDQALEYISRLEHLELLD